MTPEADSPAAGITPDETPDIDDSEPTQQDLWYAFAEGFNAGEFLDLLALGARDNPHARRAYALLREATGDAILSLEARLLILAGRP